MAKGCKAVQGLIESARVRLDAFSGFTQPARVLDLGTAFLASRPETPTCRTNGSSGEDKASLILMLQDGLARPQFK